jgi:hypothetical protein
VFFARKAGIRQKKCFFLREKLGFAKKVFFARKAGIRQKSVFARKAGIRNKRV